MDKRALTKWPVGGVHLVNFQRPLLSSSPMDLLRLFMHQVTLDDIRLINQIARLGSFARAADSLSLLRPNVTRRVKQLEQHLGVSLFHRSTRKLSLTHEGRAFLEHSLDIETRWSTALEQMKSAGGAPSGTLRISALGLFNRLLAGPVLSRFMETYPGIRLEMKSTWSAPDATKFDVDIMFNTKPLDDKSFICEPLSLSYRDFYASPGYLERKGTPSTIEDLDNHDLVVLNYTDLPEGQWLRQDGDVTRPFSVQSQLHLDEVEAGLQMTLLGHGICWLPDFFCNEHVEAGELVRLFGEQYASPGPLWAIYPRTPYENQRLRLFIEMARESQLTGKPAN
ncbi:LysR family transcriptional regulator [Ferrimonas balearica]|uniref:LysR family transcriptional regulator n=1 Tax=Ferrimonas balearica TaxID=44012 RepID=UPI001F23CC32|nr:LysR family transcriptional regulator [Ferrimonas balearica]MBY6096799.1 LysR family transcriptional regulator [Ferrimonas balearica]